MKTVEQLLQSKLYFVSIDDAGIVTCPDCGEKHFYMDLLHMENLGLKELIACDCEKLVKVTLLKARDSSIGKFNFNWNTLSV